MEKTEHHDLLVARAGTWEGTSTSIAENGTEVVKPAKEVVEAFAPYFARSHFETGDAPDGMYIGYGHHSFDSLNNEYVETWINNYSPLLVTKRGTYDPAQNKITVRWEEADANGNMVPQHSEEVREADSYVKDFFWNGRLYAHIVMKRV